jgi:hypothetical protein
MHKLSSVSVDSDDDAVPVGLGIFRVDGRIGGLRASDRVVASIPRLSSGARNDSRDGARTRHPLSFHIASRIQLIEKQREIEIRWVAFVFSVD